MWRLIVVVALVGAAAGCARGPSTESSEGARFQLAVTDTGFTPGTLTVPAGRPVTLVVTRKTDATCAKEIVFAKQGIHKELPLNRAVVITLPPSPKGELSYTCGMDMVGGKVVVQ